MAIHVLIGGKSDGTRVDIPNDAGHWNVAPVPDVPQRAPGHYAMRPAAIPFETYMRVRLGERDFYAIAGMPIEEVQARLVARYDDRFGGYRQAVVIPTTHYFANSAIHAIERMLDGLEKIEYGRSVKTLSLDFKLTRLGTTREFSISDMVLFDCRNDRKRAEVIFSTIQGELTALRDQCNQDLWVAADLCADHGFAIAEATLRANIYPQAKEKR